MWGFHTQVVICCNITVFPVKKNLPEIRKVRCPRRESNPYSRCGEQDFKSCVSTSSTTRAIGGKYSFKKNPEAGSFRIRDNFYLLSGRRDSNARPQPWQGCALPAELLPQFFLKDLIQLIFNPNPLFRRIVLYPAYLQAGS